MNTPHKTPQERVNEIENIFGISVGAGAGAKNREAREKVLAIFAEQEEEVRRETIKDAILQVIPVSIHFFGETDARCEEYRDGVLERLNNLTPNS